MGRHASDVPQPLSEVKIAGEWGVWESVAGFMPSKSACMGMNSGSTGHWAAEWCALTAGRGLVYPHCREGLGVPSL